MKEIYLVRHGQASFGEENYDKLSETGKIQAEMLRTYDFSGRVEIVHTGTLSRQKYTGKIAFPEAKFIENSCWNEMNYQDVLSREDPVFEDFEAGIKSIYEQEDPLSYFNRIYRSAVQRWSDDEKKENYREPFADFCERTESGIRNLQGQKIVVVTSAGVISALVLRTLKIPPSNFLKIMSVIRNASISYITEKKGDYTMQFFNNYQHLPTKIQTLR